MYYLEYCELYDENIEPTDDYLEEYFYEVMDGKKKDLQKFIEGYTEYFNNKEPERKRMEEFAHNLALRVHKMIAREAKKYQTFDEDDIDELFQDEYRSMLWERED